MKYSPRCDSCKHFITTDKTPKTLKRKRLFKSKLDYYVSTGYCKLGYCKKNRGGH